MTNETLLKADINSVATSWLENLARRTKAIQNLHRTGIINAQEFHDGMKAIKFLLHSDYLVKRDGASLEDTFQK